MTPLWGQPSYQPEPAVPAGSGPTEEAGATRTNRETELNCETGTNRGTGTAGQAGQNGAIDSRTTGQNGTADSRTTGQNGRNRGAGQTGLGAARADGLVADGPSLDQVPFMALAPAPLSPVAAWLSRRTPLDEAAATITTAPAGVVEAADGTAAAPPAGLPVWARPDQPAGRARPLNDGAGSTGSPPGRPSPPHRLVEVWPTPWGSDDPPPDPAETTPDRPPWPSCPTPPSRPAETWPPAWGRDALPLTPGLTDWGVDAPGVIDWGAVAQLRAEAAQRLAAWPDQPDLSEDQRRQLGRQIVTELLGDQTAAKLRAGQTPWDPAAQRAMSAAVFDMLFELGRIQPLVDDPDIEDIYITGCDPTWLTVFGQPARPGPPVADSDDELIDFLAFIASRSDPPRAFSPAQPNLDLNLAGGTARLSAQAWVTARPYATIRLHRHRRVGLDQLVALGTLSPVLASFLAAAVKAKLSIVVSGEMGAGKTTLLRALCAELDPDEPIGTFETDYELMLHDLPEQHHLVRAWEERQGQGDPNQNGGRAGGFGLDEALFASFRQSLSRQIVGEVRGREIIAMIKAMQSGTGSLSTTHARSARGAIDKLVTCAMETGVTEAYALRALGSSIDLVVQIQAEGAGRGRHRVVSQVVAVGFTAEGLQTTDVFDRAAGADGLARAAHLPDHLRRLTRHGFDLAAFNLDADRFRREAR